MPVSRFESCAHAEKVLGPFQAVGIVTPSRPQASELGKGLCRQANRHEAVWLGTEGGFSQD